MNKRISTLNTIKKIIGNNGTREEIMKIYKSIPFKSVRLSRMEEEIKRVSRENGKLIKPTFEEYIFIGYTEVEVATMGLFEVENGYAFCGNFFKSEYIKDRTVENKTLCNVFDTLNEAKQELNKQKRSMFGFTKTGLKG